MKTLKDYTLTFRHYGEITVPAGAPLTHITASGVDKNYHFVASYVWIEKNYPEIANLLIMDVATYGINVPVEFTDDRKPMYENEMCEAVGMVATCNSCDRIIYEDENYKEQFISSFGYCKECNEEIENDNN